MYCHHLMSLSYAETQRVGHHIYEINNRNEHLKIEKKVHLVLQKFSESELLTIT